MRHRERLGVTGVDIRVDRVLNRRWWVTAPSRRASRRCHSPQRFENSLHQGGVASPRLLTAVARGRLDLAVITETGTLADDVEVELLLDDPLLVAVAPSHRLAGRISAAPAEFRGERWFAGSTEHGSKERNNGERRVAAAPTRR
ncbi:LysR substrate-binding domain-containing protein [Nocardia nova]|uniref:LysR substrate-binding domain-containing protein n=1 Tax=Nocardia nova TaxID=37330 RepID=UPI000CE9AF45|nr:LysR substrate-binding domain-containing protein [Nocardia nova]PPJ24448.1 hypothetical protein C5E41_22395 [Nocardia nova]